MQTQQLFFTLQEFDRARKRVESEHVVKNTFIEIPSPRNSRALRRSCSMPKM